MPGSVKKVYALIKGHYHLISELLLKVWLIIIFWLSNKKKKLSSILLFVAGYYDTGLAEVT